jgi:hypothetical protein
MIVVEWANARTAKLISASVVPFLMAAEFVLLLVTYLLVASIAPGVLGEVAGSPARFAAWITLVRTPMLVAHMAAVSGRRWWVAVTTGEVPESAEPEGRRRILATVRDWTADIAWSVIAALIVFERLADPGNAPRWQLVAVTAAGPFLLPKLFWPLGWWRRRQKR